MTIEELRGIIKYVNYTIKVYISTNDSETNDIIQKGFFNEQEFIEHNIVKLDN